MPKLNCCLFADCFEVNGQYRFDASKLHAAHSDCLQRAIAALNARIVEATGNWPNVHGVPEDAIERMHARWEPALPAWT